MLEVGIPKFSPRRCAPAAASRMHHTAHWQNQVKCEPATPCRRWGGGSEGCVVCGVCS